jgi:hypothetical protein
MMPDGPQKENIMTWSRVRVFFNVIILVVDLR